MQSAALFGRRHHLSARTTLESLLKILHTLRQEDRPFRSMSTLNSEASSTVLSDVAFLCLSEQRRGKDIASLLLICFPALLTTTTTTTPTTPPILAASSPTSLPSLLHVPSILNPLDRLTVLEGLGRCGDVVDFGDPGFDVGGLRVVIVGLLYWVEHASGWWVISWGWLGWVGVYGGRRGRRERGGGGRGSRWMVMMEKEGWMVRMDGVKKKRGDEGMGGYGKI